MTSFSFTTGNPNNLTAGANASMADIQGPFTDLRTFLNGGTMDETNVPNLSAAFTTYKRLHTGRAGLTSTASAASIYAFSPTVNNAVVGAYDAGTIVINLDPTEFNANSRVTKLNVRLSAIVNAVAPVVTFTAGLYPVSAYAGTSGNPPAITTLGTVTSGSTVAVASPGTLARATATSGDFNFPAAGAYVLGLVVSAGPAAGSVTSLIADLSMRQV